MPNLLEITKTPSMEEMLDAEGRNPVKDFLVEETLRQIPAEKRTGQQFDHFVVRKATDGGLDIHPLKLGSYSEEELYGLASSPAIRFRRDVRRLQQEAAAVLSLTEGEVEFEHRATLLWSGVSKLSVHLGATPEIGEMVASLRVARAQFISRPTPRAVITALGEALAIAVRAARLTTGAVDDALDRLDDVGVDLNHPLAFDEADA